MRGGEGLPPSSPEGRASVERPAAEKDERRYAGAIRVSIHFFNIQDAPCCA